MQQLEFAFQAPEKKWDVFGRRGEMPSSSPYIRAMHPKTGIRPHAEAIARVLNRGWVGQLKIHGHRAQLHIPADARQPIVALTRQGREHAKAIPPTMAEELRRLFKPKYGFTVIDAEWLKETDKLFVFDILKEDGELLRRLTYIQRWEKLPRRYLSPHLVTLPLLKDLAACLQALKTEKDYIEGLVFKSTTSTGFGDTSIIRCRRPGTTHY